MNKALLLCLAGCLTLPGSYAQKPAIDKDKPAEKEEASLLQAKSRTLNLDSRVVTNGHVIIKG